MSLFTLRDDIVQKFSKQSFRAAIVMLLFFLAILFRLLYLQVVKYERLSTLSENNRIRELRIKSDRGFIKARDGFLLVKNTPVYDLEFVKEDTPHVQELLDNVSKIAVFDMKKVSQRVKKSYYFEPTKIARGLTFDQISFLYEHSSQYPGLQIVADSMRSYYDGKFMSQILGYIGEVNEKDIIDSKQYYSGDAIGKSGIEKQYETILRGQDGSRRVQVDSLGRVVEVLSVTNPTAGKNLILTIDYKLQKYIDLIMEGRQGSVVVLDNMDNSVLAMYSAPTYDLSLFTPFINDENWNILMKDPRKPLLNKAIEGAYPPGSIYKILVAMAGLKENVITPETTFFCSGSYKATAKTNIVHNCWKRSGHGEVNLNKALAESCDVYFYNLGSLLGIDQLYYYSNALSLGRLTGLDLPNEKTGVFPSKDWKYSKFKTAWYPGETVNVSIGQGYVTTTPLQLAVMISSIFNGGKVYTPRIVDAIEDPETGEREIILPKVTAELDISKEIRDNVMKGIVSAVEEPQGTSWRARVSDIVLGGKTGTAQVISMKHVENLKDEDIPDHWRDHSWFAGIYPESNPRYTVVVMLEHGGSGGKSSAPLAGAIIHKMVGMGYVVQR